MNTIAQRILDFLKDHPPFDSLDQEALFEIASSIDINYLETEQVLFEVDEPVQDQFYVVKDGAIGLYRIHSELVDHCDEGDIFGLRALLRNDTYLLQAKAIEESIIYSISSRVWKDHIANNPKAVEFVMSSLASNTIFNTTPEVLERGIESDNYAQLQTAAYSKNPITCKPNTSIKNAASVMTNKRVGSIIITQNAKPVGIITDKDLRIKVATGKCSIDEPVARIMSTPVLTFPQHITVAEAQLAMLRHKITHLCITKDGTQDTELIGILSEHDIVVLREMTAASLVKEIKRSSSIEILKQIRNKAEHLLKLNIEQNVPIDYLGRLMSTINDSITQKIIADTLNELGNPPCNFAWIAIGSQGRQEQLLLTDQDNALVYEDVPESKEKEVKSYFLRFSEKVNKGLEVVGFEICPANMMASNPEWCMALSDWKDTFRNWILNPSQDTLMLSTIFFDFELVYGEKHLVHQLSESIFSSIDEKSIFLNYLARNALQNPPPLSFFRQFLVEDSGTHKDQFDIKARAIMPLVDAARVLTLYHKTKDLNNTLARYKNLAELEDQNKEVFLFCAEAFMDLLQFRTSQGLNHGNSGRFIELLSMSKSDRLKLKRSFKAIKLVQQLIITRFKLSQLM